MTPDLQKEFQTLRESAFQRLKDIPASGSCRHVFSLWIFPSFSPAVRCTVYGKQPVASFTIWRSDLDLEKLRTPVERLKYPKDLSPTFEEHILVLADTDIAEIERRINGVSIPFYLAQPRINGIDGTSFEFRYGEFFFGASIRWWEGQPEEWRPLTKTLVRILEELDERRKRQVSNPDNRLGVKP